MDIAVQFIRCAEIEQTLATKPLQWLLGNKGLMFNERDFCPG
jgi:hypothetical protein